jgi:hypothetical protein
MNPLFAMDLIGMPFNGTWKLSDIGLLVLAILFIIRIYQRLDKFEETLAKRLEAKIQEAERAKPREIYPQPLGVKLHEEVVTVPICIQRHGALKDEVTDLNNRVELGFKELNSDRSRSTGNLHARIEEMDRRAGARTEALRLEMKQDFRGVHERINTVLEGVAELRGKHVT